MCQTVKIKWAFRYPKVHQLMIIETIKPRRWFNLFNSVFRQNGYSYTAHATRFKFSKYNIKINGENDSKYFIVTCDRTVADSKNAVLSLPALAQASFDAPPPISFNHMSTNFVFWQMFFTAFTWSRDAIVPMCVFVQPVSGPGPERSKVVDRQLETGSGQNFWCQEPKI